MTLNEGKLNELLGKGLGTINWHVVPIPHLPTPDPLHAVSRSASASSQACGGCARQSRM